MFLGQEEAVAEEEAVLMKEWEALEVVEVVVEEGEPLLEVQSAAWL